MITSLIAIVIGFVLDLIIGDPYNFPHPIRFIGNLISKTEKILRDNGKKEDEFKLGILLVVIVTVISTIIPIGILVISYNINIYLGLFIESIMCYQILCTKSLKDESMKVYYELKKGDLINARKKLSMIVGRDVNSLDEKGVAKAAIETVAENTSDGVIAPLLYMIIGGAPLGFLYKSINTMDSMVGYKNEKYINFGKMAAKLDDVANYIPARISAYLLILSSFILKLDWKNAYKIYKRDRYNHASPNSAHTEAVCAGALNIQLAGDAYYFGKLYKKPTIGDKTRDVSIEDISLVNKIMYVAVIIPIALIILTSVYINLSV